MSRPVASRSPARPQLPPPSRSGPSGAADLRERLTLLLHEGAIDPKRWREFSKASAGA